MAINGAIKEQLSNKMKSLDVTVTGLSSSYSTSYKEGGFLGLGGTTISGQNLVGITPQLASQFGVGLETYKKPILDALNTLEALEPSGGFKGDNVTNSIKNFIMKVKEVSLEYLNDLDNVERNIIAAVEKSYSTQDENLNTSIKGDSTIINDSNFSGVTGGGNNA